MIKVFNIPQSEEQSSPIQVEGESSQEIFPNQEADQAQVDLSVTHGETNHCKPNLSTLVVVLQTLL